jgi:hypothetical protein
LTLQQVRAALAALMHNPPVPRSEIARLITHQLRRNEQARRACWRKLGLPAPSLGLVP